MHVKLSKLKMVSWIWTSWCNSVPCCVTCVWITCYMCLQFVWANLHKESNRLCTSFLFIFFIKFIFENKTKMLPSAPDCARYRCTKCRYVLKLYSSPVWQMIGLALLLLNVPDSWALLQYLPFVEMALGTVRVRRRQSLNYLQSGSG